MRGEERHMKERGRDADEGRGEERQMKGKGREAVEGSGKSDR